MARTYDEDELITDALASAIGHMIVQWGHLEDNASVLTGVLLKADLYAFRGVSTNLGTASKFDTLSAIAKETLSPRKADTIVKIAERAKRLTAERNRIVHGSWYPTKNPDVGKRYSYNARGKVEMSEEGVSVARLRDFTKQIVTLRRRLNHALARQGLYRREPTPSNEK